jgi:hypothetical protein
VRKLYVQFGGLSAGVLTFSAGLSAVTSVGVGAMALGAIASAFFFLTDFDKLVPRD